MEFLKELFNGGSLTYDQLSAAAKSKGYSVVDIAGGVYAPKHRGRSVLHIRKRRITKTGRGDLPVSVCRKTY